MKMPDIDMRDILQDVTVEVTVTHVREAEFKVRIALAVCRWAVRFSRMKLKVNNQIGVIVTDETEPPEHFNCRCVVPYEDFDHSPAERERSPHEPDRSPREHNNNKYLKN